MKIVCLLFVGICASSLYAYGPAPQGETDVFLKPYSIPAGKIPIFYRPEYNIHFFGIENLHPFDAQKFGRIHRELLAQKAISNEETVAPPFLSEEMLRRGHSAEYLESLKHSSTLEEILEIPLLGWMPAWMTERQVLFPMRYATAGSVLAAQAAMERGWAINLGGGFHHAYSEGGGGFCAYADITLAIRTLREVRWPKLRAMIVDLDAHQGNGHETDFLGDPNTFIVDVYNKEIYPDDAEAKKAIGWAVELESQTSDEVYLERVAAALREADQRFRPDIVIFNAGTDIMAGDQLGDLNISGEGIIRRDELVFDWAKNHHYPILMLLSGGYQKENAPVIARSIVNLFARKLVAR